jgi:hypothetical protein
MAQFPIPAAKAHPHFCHRACEAYTIVLGHIASDAWSLALDTLRDLNFFFRLAVDLAEVTAVELIAILEIIQEIVTEWQINWLKWEIVNNVVSDPIASFAVIPHVCPLLANPFVAKPAGFPGGRAFLVRRGPMGRLRGAIGPWDQFVL